MTSTPRPVPPGTVRPRREVPASIVPPPYLASGGVPPPRQPCVVAEASAVERLRRAGQAAARVLARLRSAARAGVTTDELDGIAHDAYLAEGGYPSTLGYKGYPKSLCTSVNEVVAHGIPDDRPLADGDIVNCDVTIYLDGMHGDCSATFLVGDVEPGTRALVAATEQAMWAGIGAVVPGGRLRDIGRAIQRVADGHGYGVVRELVGHGIGEQFHGVPWVYHYDEPRAKGRLTPGMAFTIEPMLTLGAPDITMRDDGWTVVTLDGQPSAQFEHTVLVTDLGVEVITALPG